MKSYDHQKIEKKWQKEWDAVKLYKTESSTKKKKFYVLDMFPYPSGAGLHVGHPRGYIGSDVYARMKRMQGYNVLHPMGYDAFGLPAEQYAIEHKIHPRKAVEKNVATFEKQLSLIGLSYDWSRKVNTTDPEYYRWTQWIFLQIYNSWYDKKKDTARPIDELVNIFEKSGNEKIDAVRDFTYSDTFSAKEWKGYGDVKRQEILMKYRLAYEGYALVNWCPKLGTVLANDEIVDDKEGNPVSERGGYPVEKISMRQWFMRITAYADRLIKGLDTIQWSSHIKEIQKNWIGKSQGSEINFEIVFKNKITRKILIGTRNEAKFRMAKECLPEIPGVEFVSLNDIAPVDDSTLVEGMDYVENAKMKAEFYYQKTGLSTLSMDNVFWLEKWKKDNGVMIHMRKEANPKTGKGTDDEVLAYLKSWVKKVGGKSKAHFIYAIAFASPMGTQSFVSTQRDYVLQGKQGNAFWPGYPTEALLVDAKTKEYKGDQDNAVRYSVLIKDFKAYTEAWFNPTPKIPVFTTRADTIYGATYMVLAPDHPWVTLALDENHKGILDNANEVRAYVENVKKKTEAERQDSKEKTGVEVKGIKAINPANGEKIPVYVADYVLANYGTGAVMAVPAHDERDYEFAKKYNLPMKRVVEPKFVYSEGEAAYRKDEPFIKRNAICAIVRNPKNDTYLCTSWKKFKMHGLVTGGIEEGEDPVETARREVYEETGYKNIKLTHDPKFSIHTFFYHRVKQVNRHARFQYFFFDLIDEEHDLIGKEESDIHDVVWIPKNEIKTFFTVAEGEFTVNLINNTDYIHTEEGILHNSGDFSGFDSDIARKKITEAVGGKIVTKYKMRDAIFARQRYWGEPIPLKTNKDTGIITALPQKSLPLVLPNVTSYEPTGTGESPLASVKSWIKEGYETNTMPGWAGSSWYFLRYMDPDNSKAFAGEKALSYWKDVDMYVGGQEHATGHLLYSRFWHKFLYDMGYVPTEEPFKTLKNQGLIIASDGRKMSKRWGNVINPDDIVKTYGADTLRVYEMFMGPFDQSVAWSTDSIIGSRRFLEKVWRGALNAKEKNIKKTDLNLEKTLHKTIKKVTEDIETMNFNTAISSMMMLSNEIEKSKNISIEDYKIFLSILSPFAPHMAEELWRELGEKKSIHKTLWPAFDKKKVIDEEIKIAIQINGKVRSEMMISRDMTEEEIKKTAVKDTAVISWTTGKEIKRIIYVPGRLINIVI